jgi:hypothetical protein
VREKYIAKCARLSILYVSLLSDSKIHKAPFVCSVLKTDTFLFLGQIGWIRLVYSKLVKDGSGSGIKTGGPLKAFALARIAATQFRPG